MAERAIPTALLFQKVSKFLKGDAPAVFAYLSLCGESMSGFGVDTTDFTDELTRQAVTPTLETVTKTDDTIVMTKASWTPGADTIYGAGVFTGLADATLQIFHEWAASVTFEASDTLTETIKLQSKLGT
jgi:hypothetical protein